MSGARHILLSVRARQLWPGNPRMQRDWIRARFLIGCKGPKVQIGCKAKVRK